MMEGESSSVGDLIAFARSAASFRKQKKKDIIFALLSPEALKFYDTKFGTAY